jgi:DNA (cytosine-5)-methyltransferase 1
MKKTFEVFEVVDMFCGAGGESTGIKLAAQEQGMNVRLTAINHWERAIETHAANHPSAEHLCQSVEQIDPTKAVPGQRLDLLWASPECTHHSIARGGRPRSDQSRASAWLILKWLSELYVERVIIENVPEFMSWGPLDDSGKPVQSLKGKTFRAFISSLQSLGYTVDWRILCAADYGDPTTRRRLFIQAVKGRKRILWPQITHIDGAGNLMGYQPWRPARDIIDWSIPGTSIFDRRKPLADATIRRIAAGIEKYWKDYAKPFLAVLYGSNDARSLDLPLPTVTASGHHHALVEPLLVEYHGTRTPSPVSLPVKTITTKGHFALLEPFLLPNEGFFRGNRARSLDQPLSTVTASRGFGALVEPTRTLDIRFRMLKNHELKKAQGFPDDYVITGNTTEQTKQIGNAVPVNTAKALALAAMERIN